MAYAFVQQVQGAQTTAATSIAAASITPTAGNCLVITAFTGGNVTISVSDTAGNTVTPSVVAHDAGNTLTLALFYVKNCLGTASVFTASWSGSHSDPSIWVGEYSGLDVSNPFLGAINNAQASPPSGANTITSTPFYVGGQPAMLFGFSIDTNGGNTVNAGTSPIAFTGQGSTWSGSGSGGTTAHAQPEDARVTTAANYTATFGPGNHFDSFLTIGAAFMESGGSRVNIVGWYKS